MLIRSLSTACPLCGANHATCGQAVDTIPVDILAAKETTVATDRYRVTVNGRSTTLKLSAQEAKNYPGAELLEDAPTAEPGPPARKSTPAKSRTAANKARTDAEDKAAGTGADG